MMYLLRAFAARLFYCLLVSTALRLVARVAGTAMIVGALVLALPASNAVAGVFHVATCQADPLHYRSSAFTHFATRRMMIKRACNPEGPGLRGLVTANVVHDGRIKRGSVALVKIEAPPGTSMTKLHWAGAARRRDCRYSLALWAKRPDKSTIPLRTVKANRKCPKPGQAQAAYITHDFDIQNAVAIVQRVICVGSKRKPWCSARGLNYIRTYEATVEFVDNLPPAVAILRDTPLATGAWVSGTQPLNYTASDNVGVQFARAFLGGQDHAVHSRGCALAAPEGPFAHPSPCPNGPGQIQVATVRLHEGTQQLFVEATDAAGNRSASVPVTARIDNTPPPRVDVGVEGGEAWRNRNDWAVTWTNPPEADRAPITAVSYELCAAGTTNCSRGTHGELNVGRLPVTVPRAGEWTLSIWRRDAAGNEQADNASVPVTLRYDPEPPQLAFEALHPADPTQIAVSVNDQVSGVADGVIEIGPAGSGVWHSLGTQIEGNRLVSRIDDASLPAGTYVLRARARDRAGNEASTDRRHDGQPMVINLPLRTPVRLQAGFERKIRRDGKRRSETVLRPSAYVRFGQRTRVAGRLVTSGGHPVSGAAIQLMSRVGSDPEQHVGTLATGADGRFGSIISGTSNRILRLVYAGSSTTLPTQSALHMRVPATTSVRASRRRLRNGQSVMFSGRVRGLPVPAAGKLVEVQVRFTDRWQTFRTTRSDATGAWSSRYRFQRTRGVQNYHFRIRLPKEGGYPFETSVSRTLVVQVRGR